MKITIESAKAAIERFNCIILRGYPELKDLYSIETDTKESVELYAYSNLGLAPVLEKTEICPRTKGQMKIETLTPAARLFGLVLAAIEFAGYLDAIKNDLEYSDFKEFAETTDYKNALQEGRTLLAALMGTPGEDLKAKLNFLALPDLSGSDGQMRLLESTLGFDLKDFVNYGNPGQPPLPKFVENDEDMHRAIKASLAEVERKEAFELPVRVVVPSAPVEVKNQSEMLMLQREQLEIDLVAALESLTHALNIGYQEGALLALQEQQKIVKELDALPVIFHTPASLVANNAHNPPPIQNAALAVLSPVLSSHSDSRPRVIAG